MGCRVAPDVGKIGRESENALPLGIVDKELVGGAPVLVVLLGIGQSAQLGVPFEPFDWSQQRRRNFCLKPWQLTWQLLVWSVPREVGLSLCVAQAMSLESAACASRRSLAAVSQMGFLAGFGDREIRMFREGL